MPPAAAINPNAASKTELTQLAKKQAQATGITGWKAVDKTSPVSGSILNRLRRLSHCMGMSSSGPTQRASTTAPSSDPVSKSVGTQSLSGLTHFTQSLGGSSELNHVITTLPKALQTGIEGLYQDGKLNSKDPVCTAFLGRMGQMMMDTKCDPKFVQSTLQDLIQGDYSTLVRIQEHQADVSSVKVTQSAQFDHLVLSLAVQAQSKPEGKQSVETRHSLRLAKRALGQLLGPELGINKFSDFKFDERTLSALSRLPAFKSESANVIWGKIILLDHQLNPSGTIGTKLKLANISLSETQINTYFGQGLHNTQAHDFALQAIQNFSTKLATQLTAHSLLKGVLREDISVTTHDFSKKVILNLTGLSGASDAQLQQMEPRLGAKVSLHNDTSSLAKFGQTLGATSSLSSTLNQVNILQNQAFQLQLNQQVITDPKLKAETQSKLKKTEDKLDRLLESQSAPLATLTSLIRVAVARVFSQTDGSEDAISSLQSGQARCDILAQLEKLGVTPRCLDPLNLDSPKPFDAMIAKECRHFEGQATIHQWMADIKLDDKQKTVLQQKIHMETHPDIQKTTPHQSEILSQSRSWLSNLGSGDSFALKWGKMIKITSGEALSLAQAGLSGSMSVTGSIEADKSKLMLVQNESKGELTRFSITLSKELGASLGIELGALAGFVTTSGSIGGTSISGIKLTFASLEAASTTLAAMMSNRFDGTVLGQVSGVVPVGGHHLSVSAGVNAGFSITDFTGGLADLTNGASPIDPSIGTFSVDLSAQANRRVTTQETPFEKRLTQARTFSAGLTLSGLGQDQSFTYLATTTQDTHLTYCALTQSTRKTQVQIQTQGALGDASLAKTKAFDLASPISLQDLQKTHPKHHAQITTLLNQLQANDTIEVSVHMPMEILVKANELSDPASASYNPKAAKALLKDPKSYVLSEVKVLRGVEAYDSQSIEVGSVSRETHQQVSTRSVVGTVLF